MGLHDYLNLVAAMRKTADALRQEADYVADAQHAALLHERAAAFDRQALEMERKPPAPDPIAAGAR